MKRFFRLALGLCIVFGLGLAAWPLAQTGWARWNQARLQTAWKQAAVEKPKAGREKQTKSTRIASKPRSAPRAPRSARAWPPTRLLIPDIGLDAVVVQGADPQALRRGPGHYAFSSLPGEAGNCVIAGHRNVFGSYFLRLDELQPGSRIVLQTPRATFNYHVIGMAMVQDNNTSIFAPMTPGVPQVTLVTCTLPLGSERLIIFAQLD